ncbi:Ig-like domain repeat protein [Streptomyces sp. NPDC059477]|uniref:Ig-like domain repeat protein n=1 Tax=Streptomyces sp. NPDC059477 TaxID=3346847 RepID=UPI0036A9F03A
MRFRTLPATTALAVLFSSVVLTTAAPAVADASRPLTISSANDTVVDGVHQRIFFSEYTRVLVTDYSGKVVRALSGLSGANDMELSPDSSTLYVAVRGQEKIVAYDTKTLAKTAEYPTGEGAGPVRLAHTEGTLWFSYGSGWDSNLGALDLTPRPAEPTAPDPSTSPAPTDILLPDEITAGATDRSALAATDVPTAPETSAAPSPDDPTSFPSTTPTEAPTTEEPTPSPTGSPTPTQTPNPTETPSGPPGIRLDLAAGFNWSTPPMLYADADNPDTLVALDGGNSAGAIVVYDVSSGTPAIRVTSARGGFHNDAALTPDGQSVVIAGPNSRALVEYRLSDLTLAATYPVKDQPLTVSVAEDGTIAATVRDVNDIGDTYVFSGGAAKPASVRNLSRNWMPEWGHSLAWSPDGAKLITLTGYSTDGTFHRLDEPRKYPSTLTVSAPATAARAKKLTVSGTLNAALKLPAGTPVTVTRTDLESPNGKSLGTKSLAANGKFSFTDTPPAGGKVKYTVKYAGDAAHTAATASDTVDVSRAKPTLTLNNNGKVYAYGSDVKFTAHLGTTYKNRKVEIWADPFGGDKPNKLVKSGTVNSSGNLSVTLDLTRDAKVTAKFAGDSRYQPRTVTSAVGAKVRVSTAVSGHYTTKRVWGQTYHYFRKTKNPLFTTTMSAYPGRSQNLRIEIYYNGRWYDAGSNYFALSPSGVSKVTLLGPHETGWRLRVRSSYYNSGSGDTVNSTTHGAWKYFTFTS